MLKKDILLQHIHLKYNLSILVCKIFVFKFLILPKSKCKSKIEM